MPRIEFDWLGAVFAVLLFLGIGKHYDLLPFIYGQPECTPPAKEPAHD